MTALITGATGFIGRNLIERGERVLVRRASTASEHVVGDLLDPVSLDRACAGIDTIYHCAGYAHALNPRDQQLHWRTNFEGTKNLVDAAVRAAVKRFVFVSSVKAMAEPGEICADEELPGAPRDSYGRSKRAAENCILEAGARAGMHVVNLRLAMVYGRDSTGSLERLARAIASGWFPPLPETGNRRSLVHIDDVIEVMRLVASHPQSAGKTYIVAEDKAYSGAQIYDLVRASLGRPRVSWRFPAGTLRTSAAIGDVAGRLLGRPMPINSDVLHRLIGSAWYSPARIARELGWQARIPLELGLQL